MANPEELRRRDSQLPRARRKYPQSRVTQVLYISIGLLVVAGVISVM